MLEFIHNGLRLEYEVTGNGFPFVFLHGMGGSINQIYSVYEPLEGVRLITMNQQGHGNSDADWEAFDFDHLGDDIVALLDHLNIQKAYFAGISMGAAVSLNVAVRYPMRVEKLLLIRNAWTDHPMPEEVQTAYRDLGLTLKEGGIEAFYKTEGWEIISATSSVYTKKAFISAFEDPRSIKNWQKYLLLPKKTPIPSADVLKQLTMPVCILANRNDLCHPFIYSEYLKEHIRDAKLQEIPDKDYDKAGHKLKINQAINEL